MLIDEKIYIAGHRGMVGSAIVRNLQKRGFNNLILKTSSELDLRNQLEKLEKEKADFKLGVDVKVVYDL